MMTLREYRFPLSSKQYSVSSPANRHAPRFLPSNSRILAALAYPNGTVDILPIQEDLSSLHLDHETFIHSEGFLILQDLQANEAVAVTLMPSHQGNFEIRGYAYMNEGDNKMGFMSDNKSNFRSVPVVIQLGDGRQIREFKSSSKNRLNVTFPSSLRFASGSGNRAAVICASGEVIVWGLKNHWDGSLRFEWVTTFSLPTFFTPHSLAVAPQSLLIGGTRPAEKTMEHAEKDHHRASLFSVMVGMVQHFPSGRICTCYSRTHPKKITIRHFNEQSENEHQSSEGHAAVREWKDSPHRLNCIGDCSNYLGLIDISPADVVEDEKIERKGEMVVEEAEEEEKEEESKRKTQIEIQLAANHLALVTTNIITATYNRSCRFLFAISKKIHSLQRRRRSLSDADIPYSLIAWCPIVIDPTIPSYTSLESLCSIFGAQTENRRDAYLVLWHSKSSEDVGAYIADMQYAVEGLERSLEVEPLSNKLSALLGTPESPTVFLTGSNEPVECKVRVNLLPSAPVTSIRTFSKDMLAMTTTFGDLVLYAGQFF
ncbi:uncharacterized protein VTP21DRAFT_2801 [Calcarisporiella thermophila]|uniref:uncharacterized protein n=1 Tax=Calcarisporiella thermophila TaxID=911321 RepID=UPI003743F8AE